MWDLDGPLYGMLRPDVLAPCEHLLRSCHAQVRYSVVLSLTALFAAGRQQRSPSFPAAAPRSHSFIAEFVQHC